MDRFSNRDDDFKEDVPRPLPSGIAKGFVKSDEGVPPQEPQIFGKVEIQASKRDQREQHAAQAALQAALREKHGQRTAGGVSVPLWAGQPPPGTVLRIMKDGTLVDSIPLTQPMTIFGRGQSADVVLDHQSLSRQHAAVSYHRMTSKWMATDLGSVHGTFYDGKLVGKGQPVELKRGGQLRFGASSRIYVLHQGPASAAVRSQLKKPPESSGQESLLSEARGGGQEGLQQLEEYSDTQETDVGPQLDSKPGRFADLVQAAYVENSSAGSTKKAAKRPPADLSRRPAALQPLKTGLYDYLPPPERTAKS